MKTVIEMAREAGLIAPEDTEQDIVECGVEVWLFDERGMKAIERFAELARADEREACAQIVETPVGEYEVVVVCGGDPTQRRIPMYLSWNQAADAIRNRSNT